MPLPLEVTNEFAGEWTSFLAGGGATVEQCAHAKKHGSFGAHAIVPAGTFQMIANLPAAVNEAYLHWSFKAVALNAGETAAWAGRFSDPAGALAGGIFVRSDGAGGYEFYLRYRDAGGATVIYPVAVGDGYPCVLGTWYDLEFHKIVGAGGRVEAWIDGVLRFQAIAAQHANQIAKAQINNGLAGEEIYVDSLCVAATRIGPLPAISELRL